MTAPCSHWPVSWEAAQGWLPRLERHHAAPVPALGGALAGMHLHGLHPEQPRAYLLLRLPRGRFVAAVAAFTALSPLAGPEDLRRRAQALDALTADALALALLRAEPDLCAGTAAAVAAFATQWRRHRQTIVVPAAGPAVVYPLRLPTLVRALGLDPTHPATAPRRSWLALAELTARAGLPPASSSLAAAVIAAEENRLRHALTAFPPLFDARALAALRQATQYGQDSYRFYRGEGTRGRIRRQAAAVCPPFARAIAETPALRRAVDQRRPLIPALARAFGVGEGAVRALAAAPLRLTPDQIDYLLLFLDDLDGAQRPAGTDPAAWNAFALLAHEINGLAAFIGRDDSRGDGRGDGRRQALAALLRQSGGDWKGGDWAGLFRAAGGQVCPPEPARLRPPPAPAGHEDPLHPRQRAADEDRLAAAVAWDHPRFALRLPWGGEAVRDAVRAFAHTLCLPLAAHAACPSPVALPRLNPAILRLAEAAAVALLLQGRTFVQAVGLAERFHASLGVLFPAVSVKAVALRGAALAWSTPSAPLDAPNGLRAVPLGSVQALVEAGQALGNCLPFYAVPCAVHGHRVIALCRDGIPEAALEIVRPGPGLPWRAVQLEGPANGPPSAAAQAAADWYLAQLMALPPDAPEHPPAAGTQSADVLRALCGYDWRDGAALGTMWALWARPQGTAPRAVLPRAAARKGLDGLAALPAMARLRAAVAA